MDQPFWKRLLSYFFEFHIESAPSKTNPHLYVSLRNGRYQLCTANAIYSYEDLYDNFLKAFQRLDLDNRKIKNVLILGFGLGSIPIILEKKFNNNYHFTGVELDESVLYLANKYALPQIDSPIEMINTNAFFYVMQCAEKFDMICMDIFLDDVVPTEFEGIDFLEGLKRLLSPKGILLYNRLTLTDKDLEKTKGFYEGKFKDVFPEGKYFDVNGNWILVV